MNQIEIMAGNEYVEEVRQLFHEYTQELINTDGDFRAYLLQQNFDGELKNLSEKYGPPDGRMYLVTVDGQSAGCIALRKMDVKYCEMKRLYIRPSFRGLGLSAHLVSRIVDDAKKIGYHAILLDTLPSLSAAISLYKKMGFYEVDCYNDSPIENTVFMRLDLVT